MAIGSTALFNLIAILISGAVVGLAFNRYARSWLARLGSTTRSDITAALVGIAGAFIGFHISVILGLLPSPLMHYILAAFGALIILAVAGALTSVSAFAMLPSHATSGPCADASPRRAIPRFSV